MRYQASVALSDHVTSAEHADLPFHAGCPRCREERLSGALPAPALLSPRAQALVAAGVLAGSLAAPVSGASAAAPQPAEIDDLLKELEGVPITPEEQQAIEAEVDAEPDGPADPAEPEFDDGEQVEEPEGGGPVPAEPNPAAAPAAQPEAPPAAQTPDPPTVPGPAPSAPATVPGPAPASSPAAQEPPKPAKPTEPRRPDRPAPAALPQVGGPPAPVTAPTTRTPGSAPASTAASDGATHVVRAGESLWSIAAARLGPRASAAEVAREVAQLWLLNAEAIGTGDPDLLMAGQELRLPG